MSSVILYIASSVDSYIAGKDGDISWLGRFDHGEDDYGYGAFYRRLGTAIMGANTYRQVLGFGSWPYHGVTTYIVTTGDLTDPPAPDVKAFKGDVAELVEQIRRRSDKDIWLIGGADLISQFESEQLIDEYIISIMPFMLGEGIRLFQGIAAQRPLELLDSKRYASGVVQVRYGNTQ